MFEVMAHDIVSAPVFSSGSGSARRAWRDARAALVVETVELSLQLLDLQL